MGRRRTALLTLRVSGALLGRGWEPLRFAADRGRLGVRSTGPPLRFVSEGHGTLTGTGFATGRPLRGRSCALTYLSRTRGRLSPARFYLGTWPFCPAAVWSRPHHVAQADFCQGGARRFSPPARNVLLLISDWGLNKTCCETFLGLDTPRIFPQLGAGADASRGLP